MVGNGISEPSTVPRDLLGLLDDWMTSTALGQSSPIKGFPMCLLFWWCLFADAGEVMLQRLEMVIGCNWKRTCFVDAIWG